MSDTLERCPFCGGEASVDTDRVYFDEVGNSGLVHVARCEGECGASIVGRDEAEAIAAWNRRAAPSVLIYGDTIARIAGLLCVPIAGLSVQEGCGRVLNAVFDRVETTEPDIPAPPSEGPKS